MNGLFFEVEIFKFVLKNVYEPRKLNNWFDKINRDCDTFASVETIKIINLSLIWKKEYMIGILESSLDCFCSQLARVNLFIFQVFRVTSIKREQFSCWNLWHWRSSESRAVILCLRNQGLQDVEVFTSQKVSTDNIISDKVSTTSLESRGPLWKLLLCNGIFFIRIQGGSLNRSRRKPCSSRN